MFLLYLSTGVVYPIFGLGLACQAKGKCCHTNQPLPKYLRKKRIKVQSTACHYATKMPVKITMYLSLDIIIKLKFKQILIDVRY